MQENENILPDTCNFRDVQPIMMNLPIRRSRSGRKIKTMRIY